MSIPAPNGLAYKDYQIEGIEFAVKRKATLIGDEMGLGKTIQAIGVLNEDPAIKTVLVMCPASLTINWAREIAKWQIHPRTIGIFNGLTMPDTDIVILSYGGAARRKRDIRVRIWDCIILDEAQYLSNRKSGRSKAVFGGKTSPRNPISANKKLALTGTPLRNRPEELWGLLNYLQRGLFGNFREYTRQYCDAKEVWKWLPDTGRPRITNHLGQTRTIDTSGSSNEDELREKLRDNLMIRRLKSEVAKELEPVTHQIVLVDIGAKKLHKEECRLVHLAIPEKGLDLLPYEQIIQKLHAQVDISERLAEIRHELAERKIDVAIKHIRSLQESGVDKLVVGAYHTVVIEGLRDEFGDEGVHIYGKTPVKDRQAAVDRFQEDPSCRVFIGQLDAAGTGLTLTAASMVLMVEVDWVPATIAQFIARVHRIGQTERVLAQYLLAEDSIDVVMTKRTIKKQKVLDKCLDGPKKPVDSETPQQLETQLSTKLQGRLTMMEQVTKFFELLERLVVAQEAIAAKAPAKTTRKSAAQKKAEAEEAEAAKTSTDAAPDEALDAPAPPVVKPPAKKAPAKPAASREKLRETAIALNVLNKQTMEDAAAKAATMSHLKPLGFDGGQLSAVAEDKLEEACTLMAAALEAAQNPVAEDDFA